MNETSLIKLRLSSEARALEEKKIQYRRKGAIVLILNHLEKNGYLQALKLLEQESGISSSKFAVADNVDLLYIIQEFEAYQRIKYNREFKFIRSAEHGHHHASPQAKAINWTTSQPLSCNSSISKEPSKSSKKPRKLHPIQQAYQKLADENPPSTNEASDKTLETDSSIVPLQLLGTSLHVASVAACHPFQEDSPEASKTCLDSEETLLVPTPLKSSMYPVNTEMRDLSAMILREIMNKSPNTPFDSIVGLDDAKKIIKEAVVFPLQYPELFQPRSLFAPWKGVLLYGPPGTGKTSLAKAIATECQTTFFHVSASSIVSKWRGESEKLVRVLFEMAKHCAPSTIFIDEIESILSQRMSGENGDHEGSRRMKSELLLQLDGVCSSTEEDSQVFFVAATNMPWELDIALVRRLEKRIFVGLPSQKARETLLAKFLPLDVKDTYGHPLVGILDYVELAGRTEGYSGADLRLVTKEALMIPLRRILNQLELKSVVSEQFRRDPVSMQDMDQAICTTKPSVDGRWKEKYEDWEKRFANI